MLYLVAHFIKPVPDGLKTRAIDLHMTLVHWFESDKKSEEVWRALSSALEGVKPLEVAVLGEDLFGPNEDVPVSRLEKSAELLELHARALKAFHEIGARDTESRWVGAGWNPHTAHKKTGRLYEGDTVEIDSLTLVTSESLNGERTIYKTLKLSTNVKSANP